MAQLYLHCSLLVLRTRSLPLAPLVLRTRSLPLAPLVLQMPKPLVPPC